MSLSAVKTADTALTVSATSVIGSWLLDAAPYIQLAAALIAIVAGLFAIAVHYKNLKK